MSSRWMSFENGLVSFSSWCRFKKLLNQSLEGPVSRLKGVSLSGSIVTKACNSIYKRSILTKCFFQITIIAARSTFLVNGFPSFSIEVMYSTTASSSSKLNALFFALAFGRLYILAPRQYSHTMLYFTPQARAASAIDIS